MDTTTAPTAPGDAETSPTRNMVQVQEVLNHVAATVHDGAGVEHPAVVLERITEAERELARLRVRVVCELRNVHGYSWSQVGEALGISKQGAMKVYGEAADLDFRRILRGDRPRPRRTVCELLPDGGRVHAATHTPGCVDHIPAPATPAAAAAPPLPLTLTTAMHPLFRASETPPPATPVAAPAVDVPLELEPATPVAAPAEHADGCGCRACLDGPWQLDRRPLYVIPCSAAKLDRPAPARELYAGRHFRWTLERVEAAAARDGARVMILSAEHGLVGLDDELAPYDRTMAQATPALGDRVARQLRELRAGELRAFTPKAYSLILRYAAGVAGVGFTDALARARGIGAQRAIIAAL